MHLLLVKFKRQWELYVEVMDNIGSGLESATTNYNKMWIDRKRLLEKPLNEIERIAKENKEIEE